MRVRSFIHQSGFKVFSAFCKYALSNKVKSPFIFYCCFHFLTCTLLKAYYGCMDFTQFVCRHSSIHYTCTIRNKTQRQTVQCVVAISLSPVSNAEEARTVLPTTSPLNSEPSNAQSAMRMACNLVPSAMSTTTDYSLISLVFAHRQ